MKGVAGVSCTGFNARKVFYCVKYRERLRLRAPQWSWWCVSRRDQLRWSRFIGQVEGRNKVYSGV